MANEFGPALTTVTRAYTSSVTSDYAQSLLPSLINMGYSQGMSGRGMLAAFKEAGIPVTTRQFWSLASDVRNGIANVEQVAGLDLAAVPDSTAFAPWETSHRRGYYYQVKAIFSRPGIREGTTDLITRLWGYSTSVRLTLGDVFNDLYDQITTIQENHPEYGETLVGMTIGNLYEMSP